MKNFWLELKRPILCLAPMADVTDAAFRYIIAKYSNPLQDAHGGDSVEAQLVQNFVMWTEFVSADGLVRAPEEGKRKLLKDLEYDEIERPIVAQLFTSKPEMMEQAAKMVLDLGFDGLDINMGCPDKNVEKQGAGAALMKNPKLAREIIRAAKRGVQDKIPVSVKTRLGYNKDELDPPAGGWLPELLAEEPAAITIHARTRKDMSKVPARWERIKAAVAIRDSISPSPASRRGQGEVLIFGNGDIEDVADALRKCEETGADGAMLGRAIFGTPWLFSNSHELENKEKVEILAEHIKLFDEKFNPPAGRIKSFAVMKKHFKAYLPFDKELKDNMLQTNSAEEALSVLNSYQC
jgi:nifR3 family TIM-barrel protein